MASVLAPAAEKENDKKCEIESTLVKEAELSGQGRQKGAQGKKVKRWPKKLATQACVYFQPEI